jgi:hypothetical protein
MKAGKMKKKVGGKNERRKVKPGTEIKKGGRNGGR